MHAEIWHEGGRRTRWYRQRRVLQIRQFILTLIISIIYLAIEDTQVHTPTASAGNEASVQVLCSCTCYALPEDGAGTQSYHGKPPVYSSVAYGA